MTDPASAVVTILFTDLVGSTELLSRAGDEDAQRIFRAHHNLLAEVAAAHKGEEVKWLGDGLMVAFPSAAEAVRAAVAMQQESRRPVGGERLAIRVGLNAGEALRDAADYFGTAVVVARRLCDRAGGGQILCTETVAGLLSGRSGFAFSELGKLDLKGVPRPVAACEIEYEAGDGVAGLARHAPCVGREAELARLSRRLAEASAGRGGVVLVAGEPGIGKTRLVEELAERARRDGALVAWGRCFEGEWAPPYAPFAEILEAQVAGADPEELRVDLGAGGPVLAQLAPGVRRAVPNLPEAAPLSPDEERFRLLDATAQFLLARSNRATVICCLDDLHWADGGTIAMLRHLARFAPRHRLLLVGTFRDAEVKRGHPLVDALGALPRESEVERLRLEGLSAEGTARLLAAFGEHDVADQVGAAWASETDGNPFFIAELMRHLAEEGKLYRGPDGRWTTDRPLRELGLPDTVRDVINRRLARLSDDARRLLSVASVFEGPVPFEVAARLADLDEDRALDAVDEATSAQVLRPAESGDTCVFTHTITRHTLYEGLGPPRRVRLHRKVAEALEGPDGGHLTAAQAGEVAVQYHRSRSLPGAERGVEPALAAASAAQATGGHEEAARFLRLALELLPEGEERRARLLGRLGIVLAWALAFDEAATTAAEAGDAIAESEGKQPAAEYLSDAAYVCSSAGGALAAWDLARQGLTYAGAHDVPWARLVSIDFERRAAEDPEHPGIPIEAPERRESARILRAAHLDPIGPAPMEAVFDSREEALESSNLLVLSVFAGEYARCIPLLEAEAVEAESLGRLARAARARGPLAYCEATLGHFAEARRALERADSLVERLGTPVPNVLAARQLLCAALDEGWEETAAILGPLSASTDPALAWALGYFLAASARASARLGRAEEALGFLHRLLPWLERAPAWTTTFAEIASDAAETLWLLGRLDHIDVVERAVRDKIIAPDFRHPLMDGRLAMARLCALTGRYDEAHAWFAEARRTLADQGVQSLLAVCDHDEALMLARRRGPGDTAAAGPLLESARRQFEELGMTGWLRRADELARRIGGESGP